MELCHARDLLQLTGQQQQARTTSLEVDVTHLQQFVGSSLQHNQEITAMLQSLLATFTQQHDAAVHQALSTLKEAVDRGITVDDEQVVKEALTTIQEKEPGVFRQVVDLVGKGAITGASGRLLYDFLTQLGAVLR